MTTIYREIVKARTIIEAKDATYAVQFDEERRSGRTWEFDPMSDAVGQNVSEATGKMRIRFYPTRSTMAFPEDAKRPSDYLLKIEDARRFYKFLRDDNPQFWFALDMASIGQKTGFERSK